MCYSHTLPYQSYSCMAYARNPLELQLLQDFFQLPQFIHFSHKTSDTLWILYAIDLFLFHLHQIVKGHQKTLITSKSGLKAPALLFPIVHRVYNNWIKLLHNKNGLSCVPKVCWRALLKNEWDLRVFAKKTRRQTTFHRVFGCHSPLSFHSTPGGAVTGWCCMLYQSLFLGAISLSFFTTREVSWYHIQSRGEHSNKCSSVLSMFAIVLLVETYSGRAALFLIHSASVCLFSGNCRIKRYQTSYQNRRSSLQK